MSSVSKESFQHERQLPNEAIGGFIQPMRSSRPEETPLSGAQDQSLLTSTATSLLVVMNASKAARFSMKTNHTQHLYLIRANGNIAVDEFWQQRTVVIVLADRAGFCHLADTIRTATTRPLPQRLVGLDYQDHQDPSSTLHYY